jgi:hypothetical protein
MPGRPFTRNPYGKDATNPYYATRLDTAELAARMAEKMDLLELTLAPDVVIFNVPNQVGLSTGQGTKITLPGATDEFLWELVAVNFIMDATGASITNPRLRIYQEWPAGGQVGQSWISAAITAGGQSILQFHQNGETQSFTSTYEYTQGRCFGTFKPGEVNLIAVDFTGTVAITNFFLTFRKVRCALTAV